MVPVVPGSDRVPGAAWSGAVAPRHAGTAAEELLPGGFIAEVVRVGDTVRRTPPANAGFVVALLRHLEPTGLAPRYLGYDERGRQMLSHLDGRVPWREREDPAYFSDAALTRLGALIRALHDACAGTLLASDAETVCHRDLSPKNTVYRDSDAGPLPVAFLDWDLAELGRRCRLLCDTYEAPAPGPPLPRHELVDVMLGQIEGTWRGIEAGADRDEPGMRRLRAAGAVEGVRSWQEWLLRHRTAVQDALHA